MKRGLLLEEMTVRQEVNYTKLLSSPARGTWVEIRPERLGQRTAPASSPARGTWVEMEKQLKNTSIRRLVVSRTGDVG